jgi:cob(I)alamin adenosyltransferase
MVKINKIYTRTGDDGTTGLVGGGRISKSSSRIDLLGEIDELNAMLGVTRTQAEREKATTITDILAIIQNELFDIGSEVATPPDASWPGMLRAENSHVERLEKWIDALTDGIPELRSFVIPGGTDINASLHCARTVCRRVERHLIESGDECSIPQPVRHYFNRLSDLLFAMARYESHRAKVPEYLWIPGKDRAPSPAKKPQ